jgi:hypothetical protein
MFTNANQSKINIISSSQASEAHQSGPHSPRPKNLISQLNNRQDGVEESKMT